MLWVMCVIGWLLVYALPNTYQSRAQVYVQSTSILRPLLRDLAVQTDVLSQVEVMSRALLSSAALKKVVRVADIDIGLDGEREMEEYIDKLRARIDISTPSRDVYEIHYQDPSPQRAQRVVQALLDTLIEETLGLKRSDTGGAKEFLEKQIQEYEVRLTDNEKRMAEFKKQHLGVLPSAEGDLYQRLQGAQDQRAEMQAALDLALQKRNLLQSESVGEGPVYGAVNPLESDIGSPTEGQLAQYREKLAALSLQFTDNHPDILALKQVIADLEARGVQQDGAGAGLTALSSAGVALGEAEQQVAALQKLLDRQQAVVNRLSGAIGSIPEVEAKLAHLNRDYEVLKTRHDSLLQRLQTAELSSAADLDIQDVEFRVVESPQANLNPTGPNRLLYLSLVFAVSLLAAVALAMFLHQIKPVFITSAGLRQATGLPVFGTISVKHHPAVRDKMRRDQLYFSAGMALIFVAFGMAMLFHNGAVHLIHSVLTLPG